MIARRNLVAIAVLSSAVMEVLDTSVVNVSLPHIAGSLSATTDEATWVLTSYLVANAIILPMSGWLANYFGRKRLLLTVVTGFTVSSLLCGPRAQPAHADSVSRDAGRHRRRLAAAFQAVLLEEFPPQERGKAMALFGLASWPRPYSAPPSAGGSPTLIPGVGSSTLTCRWASPASS